MRTGADRRKKARWFALLVAAVLFATIFFATPSIFVTYKRMTGELEPLGGQTFGPGNALLVVADYGGSVLDRMAHIELLEREHRNIRVSGICASACTMYLGQDNICTYPGAAWMFHAIRSDNGRASAYDPFLRRMRILALDYYPVGLREWIGQMDRLMRPDEAFWISGKKISEAGWVPLCEEGPGDPDVEKMVAQLSKGFTPRVRFPERNHR